ncbi:hypothetical protein [Actinophytocola xinjiangensis]|nr:hypothetical protein [Actinophytocola xinjiangensis]
MGDQPRTRLEQILRQRHLTLEDFRRRYERAAGTDLSERQAYRWVAGDLQSLPYPHAQAALERLFGEPAAHLFGAPYGTGAVVPARRYGDRGSARTDWQGQVVAMSADRARDFLTRAEASNVGAETIDQLADDIRRLAVASREQTLIQLLGDLVDTQDRAFNLLEGRQKPDQARDLYLLAGVATGFMAKVSHDVGAAHDAMTQARTAYVCADNAGHDGLRTWVRGLQSGIAYWSGRRDDALRYAEQGAETAARSRGSASIRLSSGQARALAALGRIADARVEIDRAAELRERFQPDDLDNLGGGYWFPRSRQLYFAADALTWAADEAPHTERLATEALDALTTAPAHDRGFGDEPGARCALALARVQQGNVDGAAEALAPVLELKPAQRIHGIVTSVEHVHIALHRTSRPSRTTTDLLEAIQAFTAARLSLPKADDLP